MRCYKVIVYGVILYDKGMIDVLIVCDKKEC